jgi:uncharacterized membrane protein
LCQRRQRTKHNHHAPPPTRIIALADGIFAIAMTLLVLDLRVPAADLHGDDLAGSLCALEPRLLVYVVSFVLISQFWLALHAMFHNNLLTSSTTLL